MDSLKLKILIIIPSADFSNSGIAKSVMLYYKHIDKSDICIDFLTNNRMPEVIRKEIEDNGSKTFEVFGRNKHPLKYVKELRGILFSNQYDIVHIHGNSCILAIELYAAKKAGVEVRIAHSRNTTCHNLLFHKMLRPLFNRSYTHAFACGEDAGKWLFHNKPFIVVPNGKNIDKFKYDQAVRDEYRKKYFLENKKVIGHVGSFSEQKNHTFLIDTFFELKKINPECMLVLLGDGHLETAIKQKADKMGIGDSVLFAGQSTEIEKWMQVIDILVLPSKYEGLPNVIIEGQIASLTCLVSDNVTREAKITNLVIFMPLEAGALAWAEKLNNIELIDRNESSQNITIQVAEAGYDIVKNAEWLKMLYFNLSNGGPH